MVAPLLFGWALIAITTTTSYALPAQSKVDCVNYKTDFSVTTQGWIADHTFQDTYDMTSDKGIEMKLMPPTRYVRMHDQQSKPLVSSVIVTILVLMAFLLFRFALQSIRRQWSHIQCINIYALWACLCYYSIGQCWRSHSRRYFDR